MFYGYAMVYFLLLTGNRPATRFNKDFNYCRSSEEKKTDIIFMVEVVDLLMSVNELDRSATYSDTSA